jgi:hypothetical protein
MPVPPCATSSGSMPVSASPAWPAKVAPPPCRFRYLGHARRGRCPCPGGMRLVWRRRRTKPELASLRQPSLNSSPGRRRTRTGSGRESETEPHQAIISSAGAGSSAESRVQASRQSPLPPVPARPRRPGR